MKKIFIYPFIIIVLLSACSGPFPTATPLPAGIPVNIPTLLPTYTLTPPDPGDTPAPPSTPFVMTATRLTEPGCCVQPFWSADGTQIYFIDRPASTGLTGFYGLSITGGDIYLFSEQIGIPSPDRRYLAFQGKEGDLAGQTIVQEIATGEQWVIPNGGLRVFFSPDSTRLAWATAEQKEIDTYQVISVSDLDGSNITEVARIYGNGIGGWIDDDHLLLEGKNQQNPDTALYVFSVLDGTRTELVRNQQVRHVQIAPGGGWIFYTIALHPTSPEKDGLWVVKADGSTRYKLEVAGDAQWRDETHLLIIPFEPDAPSHRLWQFDAETANVIPLTDPAELSFRVMNRDWHVSPTGEYVIFVSAADQAIWLIALPPVEQVFSAPNIPLRYKSDSGKYFRRILHDPISYCPRTDARPHSSANAGLDGTQFTRASYQVLSAVNWKNWFGVVNVSLYGKQRRQHF